MSIFFDHLLELSLVHVQIRVLHCLHLIKPLIPALLCILSDKLFVNYLARFQIALRLLVGQLKTGVISRCLRQPLLHLLMRTVEIKLAADLVNATRVVILYYF